MAAAPPLSREDFLREMENQAAKLKGFIRELREGEWEKFDINETFTKVSEDQERVTVVINASRLQKLGAGLGKKKQAPPKTDSDE
jgi:hypothetical protein